MQPSSKIEVFSFRRLREPSLDLHAFAEYERPFDSARDTYNGAGYFSILPDLQLPLAGNAGIAAPSKPFFRGVFCEAVSRISVYLVSTTTSGMLKIPNQMILRMGAGLESLEEQTVEAQLHPLTTSDGGHLFTWTSPRLFTSITFGGVTLNSFDNEPVQAVSLRLYADDFALCCTPNPIFNPPLSHAPE